MAEQRVLSSPGVRRLALISVLLAAETTAAVQFPHPWFNIYLYRGVPVFFALALLFFGRTALDRLPTAVFQVGWAAAHAVTLVSILLAEVYLTRFQDLAAAPVYTRVTYLWVALLFSLVPSLLLTFFRWADLLRTTRRLGRASVYAGMSSLGLVVVMEALHRSWIQRSGDLGLVLQNSTFASTHRLLLLLYPKVTSDPETHLLGTAGFKIIVGTTCSGIQGLALLSVILVAWLIYDRKRLRAGRVLLLGAFALLTMWALNIVRLATLIAIGSAGHPQVALSGFHSEAGWIALNAVTLGLFVLLERVAWFQKPALLAFPGSYHPGVAQSIAPQRNLAAIYLLPFVAITAASVASRALAGGFEWFYPLRFVAAALALWLYRKEYREIQIRFEPAAVAAGTLVAILWIAVYRFYVAPRFHPGTDLAQQLQTIPLLQKSWWISLRVLAAVTTVPLAEELAFRGFLARRVTSPDVEAVPYARLSVLGILLSGICFGLLHGQMWMPGILSGFLFGWIAKYKNQLGSAVVAHAVANGILAVWILSTGDFGLW